MAETASRDISSDLDWRGWLAAAAAIGWLRPLDLQFAELLARKEPTAAPLALISAALASGVLAQGHVCLPLAAALRDLVGLLDPAAESGDPAGAAVDDLPAAEALAAEIPTPMAPAGPGLPSALTLASWRAVLAASPVVWQPGSADTQAPLVLLDDRLYLRRYWRYQETVAGALAARINAVLPLPTDLERQLDAFFDALRDSAERDRQAVHWQSIAAALAARRRFAVVSGGPGTGKTTTVVRLLGLLQQLALDAGGPLRIRLAAPTGKAAARLTESIGAAVGQLPAAVRDHVPVTVSTLHRLLRPLPDSRRFRHGPDNPLHADLLVIDEASMVDLELMAHVVAALPRHARLILLGDKDQLASVEAGAVLSELCRGAGNYSAATAGWLTTTTGYAIDEAAASAGPADQVALLRKSHRFHADSGIGRLATAVNAGDRAAAAATWSHAEHELQRCRPVGPTDAAFRSLILDGIAGGQSPDLFAVGAGYRHYLEVLHQQRPARTTAADAADAVDAAAAEVAQWAAVVLAAFGRFQLLAALRRGRWGVEGLNIAVAEMLASVGLLTPGPGWYEGRPVIVTRNDYGLGLMNGDVGVTLALPGGGLRVFFHDPGGEGVRSVAASRLAAVETVFAMTVHKSQGSEFEHAVLVLPDRVSPLLTRELVYTAITRARSRFTLVEPSAAVWDAALQRRVVRASGLGDRLTELVREPPIHDV